MNRTSAWRLVLVLTVSGLMLAFLAVRAAQFSIIEHEKLAGIAAKQQTDQIDIPAKRGPLLDRCGRVLACMLENPSLAVRLKATSDRAHVLECASQAQLCTNDRAREILSAQRAGFFWLRRDWLSGDLVRSIPRQTPEIEVLAEMKRYHPSGPIAPRLLGLVGTDGHGLSGLEYAYESWLSGEPGRKLQFVTGSGRPQNAPPARTIREPGPGGGLVLTLDRQFQDIARYHLREGLARVSATAGFAIVIDPWTGAVLALVDEPEFDPIAEESLEPERLKQPCIMDQYEPGSVWKIVPFCAALEAGIVCPTDTFFCHYGERRVHGCTIHDVKKLGSASAADILVYSSNIGTGKVAERCGAQIVCDMAQRFGFGQPTGIELAGEASGSVPHPYGSRWSQRSLVTLAYGQEIACSGLQLAMAFTVIANGGHLLKPRLVHAQLDSQGRIVRRFTPEVVRRVISAETAQTMTELLRRAVTDGTGKGARIEDFPPAGKTGTAQVTDPLTGAYSRDEHVLSFGGFAPYDNPRCVCLVSIRAKTQKHAGEVVAPVFAAIMRDIAWLLRGEDWAREAIGDSACTVALVPDVRGLPAEAARQALHRSGLVPVLEGSGSRVASCDPAPYSEVEPGSVIVLRLDSGPERASVKMPELTGLSLRRAAAVLSEAGLGMRVRGSGWVTAQTPAAGEEVAPSTVCALEAAGTISQSRGLALARRDFGGLSQ